MSIIDDWLRQWPSLTLTRDQRENLEELIDEETEGDFDPMAMNDEIGEEDVKAAFKAGARAMCQAIAAEFNALDGVGSGVGDVVAGFAKFVNSMALPEMPEPKED